MNTYDHNTPITFGRYKFKKIIDLPLDYLEKLITSAGDGDLRKYLSENLDSIRRLKELGMKGKEFCNKVTFIDEKSALKRVREIQQENGDRRSSPARVYKCHTCGDWHLTSKT